MSCSLLIWENMLHLVISNKMEELWCSVKINSSNIISSSNYISTSNISCNYNPTWNVKIQEWYSSPVSLENRKASRKSIKVWTSPIWRSRWFNFVGRIWCSPTILTNSSLMSRERQSIMEVDRMILDRQVVLTKMVHIVGRKSILNQ